jgi:LPXTG-motif cell wall-anchored protein
MIRRTLLLAGLLLAAFASPALAQPYDEGVTVSPAAVAPGSEVTVSACCYLPGTTVMFSINGQPLGSAVVNSGGVAAGTFIVPSSVVAGASVVGAAGILPDGTPGGFTGTVQVGAGTVATVPGLGGLPVTGSSQALPFSLVAVLLLAGGGAALLASRRRDADMRSDSPS